MKTMYKKYLELNINGYHIGLEQRENENRYFCTPRGAKIIGWAGVDGIHFCFLRSFGEMVFAVSPMNAPGNYVHPLARNFAEFLRLLLACGHTAALEQAWCWNQDQFDEFLREDTYIDEQSATLNIIRTKLCLTPMEQPFACMKTLQNEFDYDLIKYTDDYHNLVPVKPQVPEWKVYFDGNFWGHSGNQKAGKEIPLNRQFIWNDEIWKVPSIYICGKGLIVDFYLQVLPEHICAFMDKWDITAECNTPNLTVEQWMQFDTENPLTVNINSTAVLNGIELPSSHGCGICWNPCFPEGNDIAAESAMLHYGLDHDQGYAIWRCAFPWKTKRKPLIKTLSVTLMRDPVAIPGQHFTISSPDDQIELMHPSTGQKHTLIVQEYEQQYLSAEHFNDPHLEFPGHYTMMSYTLSPDLSNECFSIADSAQSDQPRQRHPGPDASQVNSDICCIGIIGSADAPTAIVLGERNQGKLQVACSALRFEPAEAENVEWRTAFYEKQCKDISVELI